jgi:chemotaxis protein MotA
MKAIPTLYKKAIGGDVPDLNERAQLLVGLAERARREGLLALDDEIGKIDDEYVKKGLQLIVDGTDADVVADVLEIETEAMGTRHSVSGKVFKDAGGFSPTIGIIGTVMGLVHVLENLATPDALGPLIAGAFVATLWGVTSANVLWLPLSNRLKRLGQLECDRMELAIEGVAAIQAGSNPRIIAQKLTSLLPSRERAEVEAA